MKSPISKGYIPDHLLQKLQRAIADYRGISYERLIGSPAQEGPSESSKSLEGSQASGPTASSGAGAVPEAKRKYRRHPKPDESAPERPPSAYVIFSNKVREEVKAENLSFTQIAKLVGDRWQKLDPAGKEPYESQANAAKERYNIQLSTYKKTEAYKEYVQYLADFKAKHGGQSEQKRPKLEPESSGGSISAKSLEIAPEMLVPAQGHTRGGSVGSIGSSSMAAAMPSPAGLFPPSLSTQTSSASGQSMFPKLATPGSRGDSPPLAAPGRIPLRRIPLSSQSSLSTDESPGVRSDQSDPLQRTASLNLGTPASATPPLPSQTPSATYSEYSGSPDPQQRSRLPLGVSSGGSSQFSHSSGTTPTPTSQYVYPMTSPVMNDPSWNRRPHEYRGFQEPSRILQPPPYQPSPPLATGQLPPFIAPERLAEQRTLPPPRVSANVLPQPGHGMFVRSPEPPHPPALGPAQLPRPGSQPQLDRSESDAANTLAGLARGDTSSPKDPRWGR